MLDRHKTAKKTKWDNDFYDYRMSLMDFHAHREEILKNIREPYIKGKKPWEIAIAELQFYYHIKYSLAKKL